MPDEIADSDADSHLSSPKRPAYSPINHAETDVRHLDPSQPDLVLDLPFSQFLSPTQRLSSFVKEQEDGPPEHSTASTDSFLREFEQSRQSLLDSRISPSDMPDDIMTNKSTTIRQKRRFSDIENGSVDHTPPNGPKQKNSKRTKTYAGSRSHNHDDISAFFTGLGETSSRAQSNVSSASSRRAVGGYDGTNADVGAAPDMQHHGSENRDGNAHQPSRTMSALQRSYGNVSTLKSSISGYQGINIDFRNSIGGLDVNANPFGSLSQMSADEDAGTTTEQALNQPAGKAPMSNEDTMHLPHPGFSQLLHYDSLRQFETSSIDNPGVEDAEAQSHQQESSQGEFGTSKDGNEAPISEDSERRAAPTPKEQKRLSVSDDAAIEAQAQTQIRDLTTPKKRGRKPKKKRASPKSVVAVPEDDIDELHEDTQEAVINRKSASREVIEQPQEESLPAKNFSSELQLSDEFYARYPEENYKPRPSRSRSKQVVEDEEDEQFQHASQAASQHNSTEPSLPEVIAVAEPDAPGANKKQRKRAKTKRAKTSTAVAKRSAAQHNEDEEDVMRIEPTPSRAVTELSVDSKQLKKEIEDIKDNNSNLSDTPDNEDLSETSVKSKAISVNIPALSKSGEEPEAKAGPKKRGRRPKRKTEVLVDPDDSKPSHVAEQPEEKTSHNRPVLSEKNVNVPLSLPKDASEKPSTTTPEQVNEDEDTGDNNDEKEKENEDEDGSKNDAQQPNLPTSTTTVKPAPSSSTISLSAPSSSSSSSLFNARTRIGLSKRLRIPSLLRKLDRTKEPPKLVERKEKLTKKQKQEEEKQKLEMEDGDEDGGGGSGRWNDRGADGMLIEWND